MIELFMTILNMSVAASIVALVVLLARLLLKKAPKIFSYAMWGVVLLRLAIPLNFESPVSLIPVQSEIIPTTIFTEPTPRINSGVTAIDNPVNQFMRNTISQATVADSVNPLQVILFIGTLVWIIGVVALVVFATVSYIRLKRRVYDATLVEKNIYTTDKIHTAFVLGIIRPKIYVPTDVEGARLEHMIKHEQVHIHRRDYLIKPLAFLVLAVHWFNPLAWVSYYLLSKDMEMSCDEAVLRKSSADIRKEYSTALVNLSTRKQRLLSPLAFGEGSYKNVKSRIKNVLKFKKPSRLTVVACLLLLAVLVVGCTTNPPQTSTPEPLAPNATANNAQNTAPNSAATNPPPVAETNTQTQTVVLENVEMRHYTESRGSLAHPYIHNVRTNNSDKTITAYQRGMLAFDEEGKPLEIRWNSFDSDESSSYFYLYDSDDEQILPNQTEDVDGGWSLNGDGNDPVVEEIGYVLYCDKQITFEDGTVWNNPDFEIWRETYEGKRVDVSILENYYPYVQNVEN